MSQPLNRPPLQRLLFAGEAIVDLLMWIPALPERGGDVLSESAAIEVGGGFNIMAAAVRQGLPVLYCGGHGTGPWGEKVRAALAAEDIGWLREPDPDVDTGFDVALVEADGERTFITHLGAESLREPDAWNLVQVRPGDAVYVSGYGLVPSASGAILGAWAAALPPDVVLFVDPGPLVADIPAAVLDPVLARCDWWSCNQREAVLLTGTPDPAEAARRLIRRTGRADVIVRTGPDGAVLALRVGAGSGPHGLSLSQIPAPTVTAVDTTGAGDAHSGVFLAALASRLDRERRRPSRQRRRRPGRHPFRRGRVPLPRRTRPVPGRLRPHVLTCRPGPCDGPGPRRPRRRSRTSGLDGEHDRDGDATGVDGDRGIERGRAGHGDGHRY